MKTMTIVFAASMLWMAALTGCQTTQKTPIDEPSTLEGLVRTDSRALDAVYRKPGVTLTQYNKLLLRPIEVAFSKNWDPNKGMVQYHMKAADFERIKKELADEFMKVFKEELEKKGGYQLVTEPGEDVLEMRAAIVNLYINAPDTSMQTAGRSKTFTTEAGEMTLIAELHDSITGELLSRAYDRQQSIGSGGGWQWTNSVTNTADARRVIASWADVLRKALDASRM